MRAIMVMFDSLNRRMLEPYGCDWVKTPNFTRLAGKAVTFDRAFVGSMPCMPARREIHTGRYNFLHRSWGPLEPFDDSMPEILKRNGIYTHLVSDHYHYWEDGGAVYHNRYSSWEISRGQEGDFWKGEVGDPEIPEDVSGRSGDAWREDWVNRKYMRREEDQPQAKTFAMGLEFLETNKDEDNWFLHIETFDPHEPYFTQQKYKDMYPHKYDGRHFDWPPYRKVQETPEEVEHMRYESAALHSMCDAHLGKVLDFMDGNDMWKDTMLIVNTDHGFLLGEHDWWAKCRMPFYNEIANTPLFIWDPRCGRKGERCGELVATIDLAPTLYDFFGVEAPVDVQGLSLRETTARDSTVHDAVLFGVHGGHVNVTDGRYVYMRAPAEEDNTPLYNYTLMPTHMRGFFRPVELESLELAEPFTFTKGQKTMKCPASGWLDKHEYRTMLFDLEEDYEQEHAIEDAELEERMRGLLLEKMEESDAPPEQYIRLGLK
ncbi:MAG: sulfatase [Planctomycetes bacterium]|nr:sulfatase [Planctomycetota bacterium]